MNKKKQVAQLCLTPHLVCNIMVKLKVFLFIPCFYVFFLIQKFHVAFNELCLCIYIKKTKQKKNQKKFKISKIFPKKEKIFKKKKNNLWTRDIGFPSDFFKKCPFFFLSKISRFFKVFFSKWYMRIPWTKFFLNCGV